MSRRLKPAQPSGAARLPDPHLIVYVGYIVWGRESRGFEEWKARQPPRYTRENCERFWSRANALLGYDHTTLLGTPHANRIGDGMSVAGWIRLLERAASGSLTCF